MIAHSVTHLSDSAVLGKIRELLARSNAITAELLVHLAEADERKLYLAAGYSSMTAYCIGELGLSEDAAHRRMTAAKQARRFPMILAGVAEGHLHLTAVVLLSRHLTPQNGEELLRAAMGKTRAKVQELIAERFPEADVPTRIEAILPPSPAPARVDPDRMLAFQPAPARVEEMSPGLGCDVVSSLPSPAPARVEEMSPGLGCDVASSLPAPAPARVASPAPYSRVKPLAPQRYALQLTMSQSLHDKLRHAQALLAHSVPSGDVADVLERALDQLIAGLEKRKFAATDRPRPTRPPKPGGRHIPADVKRQVRKRDGDRCTFESGTGHRCEERRFLEFDHVTEVARGGTASAANLRLRCRAHNQYAAECSFGSGFMKTKREASQRAAAEKRETAEAQARAVAAAAEAREKISALFLAQPGATPT